MNANASERTGDHTNRSKRSRTETEYPTGVTQTFDVSHQDIVISLLQDILRNTSSTAFIVRNIQTSVKDLQDAVSDLQRHNSGKESNTAPTQLSEQDLTRLSEEISEVYSNMKTLYASLSFDS